MIVGSFALIESSSAHIVATLSDHERLGSALSDQSILVIKISDQTVGSNSLDYPINLWITINAPLLCMSMHREHSSIYMYIYMPMSGGGEWARIELKGGQVGHDRAKGGPSWP